MAEDPNRRRVLRGIATGGVVPLLATGTGAARVDGRRATRDGDSTAVRTTTDASSADSSPPVVWEWTGEAAGDAVVRDLAATRDGSIVAVGHEAPPGGTQNVLARKLDGNGDRRWAEAIGGAGNDAAIGVTAAPDGGVVFCGGSVSEGSAALDTVVGRLGASGALEWLEAIGRAGTNDAGHAVARTTDDGYVVAGGTRYLSGAGGGGVGRLLEIGADGTERWDRTYGGGDAGEIYDVIATSSGRYAFVGTRAAGGEERAWLGVVDADGRLAWSRTYGAAGSRVGYGLVEDDDGGFAFVGATTPPTREEPTAWVVKVDADGALDWEWTYGSAGADNALSIARRPTGGYTVAGWTEATGDADGWLLGLDAGGRLEWERTYGTGSGARFNDHQPVADGYAAGGYTVDGGATPAVWGLGLEETAGAPGRVTGVVTDPDGDRVSDVEIEFADAATGEPRGTVSPDDDGTYSIELPGDATYVATVDGVDVERFTAEVTVGPDATRTLDIDLTRTPFGRRKETKRELAAAIDDASLSLSETDRAADVLTGLTDRVEAGEIDAATAESAVTRHIWGERLVQDANTGLGPGEYGELTDYNLVRRTARAGVETVIKLILLPKLVTKKVAAHFADDALNADLIEKLVDVAQEATVRLLDLLFSDDDAGGEVSPPRETAERTAREEANAIEEALDPDESLSYDGIKRLIGDAVDAVATPVVASERLRLETLFLRPNLFELERNVNGDTVAADGLAGTNDAANEQFVDGSQTIDSRLASTAEAMNTVDAGLVDDDGILASLIELWNDPNLSTVVGCIWSLIGFVEDLLEGFYDLANTLIGTGGYYFVLTPMIRGTTGVANGRVLEITGGD